MRQWLRRVKQRPIAWMVALVGIGCAVAILHVWLRLQIIALGYDLSRERRLEHRLKEQEQRYLIELRARMDLSMIERIARSELGMSAPSPELIRTIPLHPHLATLETDRQR